jgi:hypothetical protein
MTWRRNFRPSAPKLLEEIAPEPRRVAMLWNADDLGMTPPYRASDVTAKAMDI